MLGQSALDPTALYQGIVLRSRGRVCDVQIESEGITALGCICAAPVVMSFLGVKMKYKIPVGTRVVLLGGQPAIIIGNVAAGLPDPKSAEAFRATAGSDPVPPLPDDNDFENYEGDRLDADMLEGEFALENDIGVGLQILMGFAKLKATELAKVEAFVAEDTVRIISQAFAHMSIFGDLKINSDHGRINCVQHGTSHVHEAWGQESENDPLTTMEDFKVTGVAETGRWRFSEYIGFLGDFIHTFVTDPVQAIGSLAQERAGKLRVWNGSDGTFLVSSIGDIVLERVTRIPVPKQLRERHDPEGDQAPDMAFLTTWRYDTENPWRAAYQLRDYARWLNQYHAYASFLRYSKDWSVKAESECPAPNYQNSDDDQFRANAQADQAPRTTYSCYRIMRDGSQVMLNGYGSSVTMAGPHVSVSAADTLRLEAGGDITLVAGGSIFAKAYKHIELTAVTGAWIAKARTRIALMCELGTVLLRTMMKGGQPEEVQPAAHRFGDQNLGIVLDAPHASLLASAGFKATLEGGHDDNAPETGRGAGVHATGGHIDLKTTSTGDVRVRAQRMLTNVRVWSCFALVSAHLRAKMWNLSDMLFGRESKLFCNTLIAGNITSRAVTTATLLSGRALPVDDPPKPPTPHANHVGYTDNTDQFTLPTPDGVEEQDAAFQAVGQLLYTPPQAARAARVVSDYLPRTEYNTPTVDQTLTQQIAEQTPDHPAGLEYEIWDFALDADLSDPRALHRYPWPGDGAQHRRYESTKNLHALSSEPASEHTPNSAPPGTEVPATFQRVKRTT